jgi:hypothetical protein
MTVGAVVTGLMGSVNTPGTQVTLTWTPSSDLITEYISNSSYPTPDIAVQQLTVQGVGGGQSGGVGDGSASPPNWGSCGTGGQWAEAVFLLSSLSFPVSIGIGVGGASVPWAEQVPTGNPGTDTTFGNPNVGSSNLRAYGGQASQPNAAFIGAQSSSFEKGGQWNGGAGGGTTHAGAAGGGSNYLGTGSNAAGVCAAGPGGDGGALGNPNGGSGFSFGGGGGGSESDGVHQSNSGAGSNGVLIVDASYLPAQYYNIYRQGVLLATNVTLDTFVDSNPIVGNITYFVVGVVSGVEQTQAGESVAVDIVQQPVTVPNVIGMTATAASVAIINAGLTVGSVGTQNSSSGPYNVVGQQGPVAGTVVPVNTPVNIILTISGSGWAGGETWTPNPNVTAPAGVGGDKWGANGGGITPVGGGLIGQTGFDTPVKVTVSDGQRGLNYLIDPVNANKSVGRQMSDTHLEGHTPDDTLPPGGSTM